MDEDQKRERVSVLQYAPVVRRRPDPIRWLARILAVLLVIPLGLLGMCVGGACIRNGAWAHGIIAVGLEGVRGQESNCLPCARPANPCLPPLSFCLLSSGLS